MIKALRTKSKDLGCVLSVLFVILLFAVTYNMHLWMALADEKLADTNVHMRFAQNLFLHMPETWFSAVGHPLWHIALRIFEVFGLPSAVSAALVTSLAKTALFPILLYYFNRHNQTGLYHLINPVLVFILLIVASIRIPQINPNVYIGACTPNVWHSPTQLMMAPWMVAAVLLISNSYDLQRQLPGGGNALSWKKTLAVALILMFGMLSKPVFVQCFFPAAALYFLWQWIRHPEHTRYFLRLLMSLIPTLLVFIPQMNWFFNGTVQAGLAFDLNRQHVFFTARMVLMTNLFPLLVLTIERPKQPKTLYPLVLLTFLSATFQYAFVTETGYRAQDGNFTWTFVAASFLLWMLTLPMFARYCAKKNTVKTLIMKFVGSGLLLWHFASGVYYVYYLLSTRSNF